MRKSRIEYLDMTKGFAILLVVIGHIYSNNHVRTWIYSFHMPLFFIISGCLYKYNENSKYSIKDIILKNFKRLMIPYIIFSLLKTMFNLLINGFSINNMIWQLIYIVVLQGVGELWFLPALFISELIFSSSNKLLKKSSLIITFNIMLFIIAMCISKIKYNMILLVIARSFVGTFFYCIGYYIFNIITKLSISIRTIYIMFITNIILSYINGKVGLYLLDFKCITLYVICSILGTLSILFFFKSVTFDRLSYFGKNSLIILGTHRMIITILHKFLEFDFNNYIIGFLIFIIVTLIEIPIVKLINNKLSWMIGKYNKKINYVLD